MRSVKKYHRPSRICPHRWCPRAHTFFVFLIWMDFVITSVSDPRGQITFVLCFVLVALVAYKASGRFGVQAMQDLDAAGMPNSRLEVDPSWARAASAMDLIVLVESAVFVGADARHLHQVIHRPAGDRLLLMGLDLGLLAALVYTHWRATRRPRRRVPAHQAALAAASKA